LTAVHGRAVSDSALEAQQLINKEVALPKGTYVLFAGEEQARAQSQQDFLVSDLDSVQVIGFTNVAPAFCTL
jgi:Cu/Ag efflux pump CusA